MPFSGLCACADTGTSYTYVHIHKRKQVILLLKYVTHLHVLNANFGMTFQNERFSNYLMKPIPFNYETDRLIKLKSTTLFL